MNKKKSGRRDSKSGQIVEDGKYFRARLEVGRDSRTGKPKYKTARCKTRTEAVEALAKMLTEQGMGATTPTEHSNFGQLLDHWLATTVQPSKSHNTYRQYEWICRTHIKPHLGSKQTDKVTRADVQRLLSLKATQTVSPKDKEKKGIRQDTLSSNTLQHILAVLHNAFEEAKRHGFATKNPAENVDLPRKAKQAKKQFLTLDEIVKFMAALDESDLGDLFAFMIATGTRVGEASAVRWQDVDLTLPNRPLVWIRGQLQRIDGKLVYQTGTKTSQERCLPLTSDVATRLQAIKAKRVLTGVTDPDGVVFLNSENRRLDQKHINNRLAELCGEASIPVISAHKLRHTAATLALSETGDLHGVQKMLGHSQVSLTSDLYGHATAETLRPLSNAIEKALRPIAAKEPGE